MRFILVIKAVQAIRISAVVFGVLGAAAASGACATPSAEEESASAPRAEEKATKDGPIAKRAQAFSSWETSGGASEDPGGYPYCDQGQAFVGTGRSYTGGYTAACNEARDEAVAECEATECWDKSQHKVRAFDCDPEPNACHWQSTWYGWYATFDVHGD